MESVSHADILFCLFQSTEEFLYHVNFIHLHYCDCWYIWTISDILLWVSIFILFLFSFFSFPAFCSLYPFCFVPVCEHSGFILLTVTLNIWTHEQKYNSQRKQGISYVYFPSWPHPLLFFMLLSRILGTILSPNKKKIIIISVFPANNYFYFIGNNCAPHLTWGFISWDFSSVLLLLFSWIL